MHPVTRLFGRRPKVDPLGEGVWRRVHDRYVRAVDRVHKALDGVPSGPVHDSLADVAEGLAAFVEDVHAACAGAQSVVPSASAEVPGGHDGRYLDAHRALSRAATLAAQAAEAMTMARVELRGPADRRPDDADEPAAARCVAAAQRAADAVGDLVREAGRLVADPDSQG